MTAGRARAPFSARPAVATLPDGDLDATRQQRAGGRVARAAEPEYRDALAGEGRDANHGPGSTQHIAAGGVLPDDAFSGCSGVWCRRPHRGTPNVSQMWFSATIAPKTAARTASHRHAAMALNSKV